MNGRQMLIPQFGPFAGMRVICAGSLLAMPYAASIMADFGAEVIHIERPGVGDSHRITGPVVEWNGVPVSTGWAQESRNKLALTLELNLKHPEVKEIFYGLIRQADVFMENMVWLEKLGIRDEELLQVNPKLVIVHVSGMGHAEFGGISSVCNRASYDIVGQAFSGWLNLQGNPNEDPSIVKPFTNDYVTAFSTLFAALAGYIHAQKTGEGQVVDVAQFEAMAQYMSGTYTAYTMAGIVRQRSGNFNSEFQPYGLFHAKDDMLVAMGAFSEGVYNRCIQAMELDLNYFSFAECSGCSEAVMSPKGRELDAAVRLWCAGNTAEEIELSMESARVPCSRLNDAKSAYENEHFRSRGDWITYRDETSGADIEAFGIAPKMSKTPGGVWRGAPKLGQDTDAILRSLLQYSPEQIAGLRAKGLV